MSVCLAYFCNRAAHSRICERVCGSGGGSSGGSLFGSGSLDGAALLLKYLAETYGQAGDGSDHGAQNLCVQRVLGRKCCHLCDLGVTQDLALHEGGLDVEALIELLAVIAEYTERSDGIILGGSQRGGAVEDVIELVHPQLVQSLSGQGVLDNSVLDALLAQLGTKCGILTDGDALEVHEDARAGALDTLGKCFDYCLLFAKNLCVWHV